MTPPESLLRAADETPWEDGGLALLALADWYEEHGGGDVASALRWMRENGSHPRRLIPDVGRIYEWWDVSSRPSPDRDDPHVNVPAWLLKNMVWHAVRSEGYAASSVAVACFRGFDGAVRILARGLYEAPSEDELAVRAGGDEDS